MKIKARKNYEQKKLEPCHYDLNRVDHQIIIIRYYSYFIKNNYHLLQVGYNNYYLNALSYLNTIR